MFRGNLEEQEDVRNNDAYEIQSDEESKNSATFTEEDSVSAVDSDSQSRIHANRSSWKPQPRRTADSNQLRSKTTIVSWFKKTNAHTQVNHDSSQTRVIYIQKGTVNFLVKRRLQKEMPFFMITAKRLLQTTESRCLKREEHTEDVGIATVSRRNRTQLLLQLQLPSCFRKRTIITRMKSLTISKLASEGLWGGNL